MNTIKAALLGAVAVVVVGCGHDSMHQGEAAMHEAVLEARTENARHHDAVMAVAAFPDVMLELARHEDAVAPLMIRMDAAMDMMAHCAGSGMGRMTDMMAGMRAAMVAHRAAFETASDVAGAQGECRAHASEMLLMMDQMMGAMPAGSCR